MCPYRAGQACRMGKGRATEGEQWLIKCSAEVVSRSNGELQRRACRENIDGRVRGNTPGAEARVKFAGRMHGRSFTTPVVNGVRCATKTACRREVSVNAPETGLGIFRRPGFMISGSARSAFFQAGRAVDGDHNLTVGVMAAGFQMVQATFESHSAEKDRPKTGVHGDSENSVPVASGAMTFCGAKRDDAAPQGPPGKRLYRRGPGRRLEEGVRIGLCLDPASGRASERKQGIYRPICLDLYPSPAVMHPCITEIPAPGTTPSVASERLAPTMVLSHRVTFRSMDIRRGGTSMFRRQKQSRTNTRGSIPFRRASIHGFIHTNESSIPPPVSFSARPLGFQGTGVLSQTGDFRIARGGCD